MGGLCDVINNENHENELHYATQIQHEKGDINVDNGSEEGDHDVYENSDFDGNDPSNGNYNINGEASRNLIEMKKRSDYAISSDEMDYYDGKNHDPDLDILRTGPQDGVSNNQASELLFGLDPKSSVDPRSSFVPLMDTDSGPSTSISISLSSQSATVPSATTTSSTINTISSTTSTLFSAHYPSSPSISSENF